MGTDPRHLGVEKKPGAHREGFEAERGGLGYTAQNLPAWVPPRRAAMGEERQHFTFRTQSAYG